MNNESLSDDYGAESDADSVCEDGDYMDRFSEWSSVTMPWYGDEVLARIW